MTAGERVRMIRAKQLGENSEGNETSDKHTSNAGGDMISSTEKLSQIVGLKSIRTEKHIHGDDFGRYVEDDDTSCLCLRNCSRMLCDNSKKTHQDELYAYYTQ